MLDLAIVGGTAVCGGARKPADIGISGEKIQTIAAPGRLPPASRIIDAHGMIVIPGAVDVHTHLDAELGGVRTADDFHSGTVAAAAGGITTIVDYAFQKPGGALDNAIDEWLQRARDRAVIDYGFHVAVLDPSEAALEEIPHIAARGCPSFKVFMMRRFEERARDFLKLFAAAADNHALMNLHAEDENIIRYCTARLLSEGKTGNRYFGASRPPLSETSAVARALGMAEVTGATPYFVHLSTATAIDAIRRARDAGSPAIAETRPIYLYLTAPRLEEAGGERFVGHPPLRGEADREAMWKALESGEVDVVATDHCSWMLERKLAARSFDKLAPGMSNLETLLPMLHSEGVAKGRITLERMVDLIAGNPAKIFGLYPRKGVLAEGSDADVVIFDPNRTVVIAAREMHSRSDYDPFEGFEVRGWPKMTISRGEPIVADRKPAAKAGRGRFVPRAPFDANWRSI